MNKKARPVEPRKSESPEHRNADDEEKRHREKNMDNTLAESFPASDPPSSIPDPEDEDSAA